MAFGLCVVIYMLTFLRAPRRPDAAKNAAYECGFEKVSSVNKRFHVGYGLVAILFVLFDLEIAFLIPWVMNINAMPAYAWEIGLAFFGLLIFGFFYEWKKGALDWY